MPARYLVDTSALARADRPTVRERLAPLMTGGQAAICGVVALELLYSARGQVEIAERRRDLDTVFTRVEMAEADFRHAQDLMQELAGRGLHRSAGIADVLIAACAGRAGLAIVHYDSDFDAIASVTGQPAEWIVPRGSVP